MKKNIIILISIFSFLILLVIFYFFILPQLNKITIDLTKQNNTTSTLLQFPQINNNLNQPNFPSPSNLTSTENIKIKTEISKETLKQIEESKPGLFYNAIVKNISGNKITLDLLWIDPFNKETKKSKVIITFNPEDEIRRFKINNDGTFEIQKLNLNDLKINDYILVNTQESKKIINILMSNFTGF